MDTASIILGLIICIVFIYFIYSSYDMGSIFDYEDENDVVKPKVRNDLSYPTPSKINAQAQTKPESCGAKKDSQVQMYEDNQYVNNKGFVNELMYKPKNPLELDSEYEDTTLLDPQDSDVLSVPSLNSPQCELSTDLPLANVNVAYLLDKKTSKLVT